MSIRLKTILGIGLIEAILLAILITTVLNYMEKSNKENLENYVDTTSTLFSTAIKDAVLSLDLATLDSFTEEMLKNKGVLYTKIFDSNNNMLASGGNPNLLEKDFKIDKSYDHVDDTIYNSRKEIEINGHIYGHIELGISTKSIESAFNKAKRLAGFIAIAEMGLVALFSYILGSYLTRQLKLLRKSARNIAAGDFDQIVDVKSHDEIGEVSESFNKMIVSLNKARKESENYLQELDKLNKSLEDRVERRTNKILEQKSRLEEAYEKLKLTQKQLIQSEKMASIGQLAAGVAHEINNPVAFIKSNLTSLKKYIHTYNQLINKQEETLNKKNNLSDEETIKLLEELESYKKDNDIDFINDDIENLLKESIEGASRVEEIVKGLKTYSHESTEVMENHDINECMETTLKMLNNETKHKCEVIFEKGELPPIPIERGKIIQVFTNLIVNAIQAIEKEGIIKVKTEIKEYNCNNVIQISVSDNGKGIPSSNLDKLFDPFFTTKDVGQGTGLGLSISQGIIQDHHGTIKVDSTLNSGTTFTIDIPAN